jgi:hypothetical protein
MNDFYVYLHCWNGIVPYLSPNGTNEMHCLKSELLAFVRALLLQPGERNDQNVNEEM